MEKLRGVAEVGCTGNDHKNIARLRGHELYGKSFHWDITPWSEFMDGENQ